MSITTSSRKIKFICDKCNSHKAITNYLFFDHTDKYAIYGAQDNHLTMSWHGKGDTCTARIPSNMFIGGYNPQIYHVFFGQNGIPICKYLSEDSDEKREDSDKTEDSEKKRDEIVACEYISLQDHKTDATNIWALAIEELKPILYKFNKKTEEIEVVPWTLKWYFTKTLESLEYKLDRSRTVIMGSFVLHNLLQHLGQKPTWKPHDIDIFVLGQTEWPTYVSDNCLNWDVKTSLYHEFGVFGTPNDRNFRHVTTYDENFDDFPTIQMVKTEATTALELAECSDLDIASVQIIWSESKPEDGIFEIIDNWWVICPQTILESIKSNTAVSYTYPEAKYHDKHLVRITKYKDRGYTIVKSPKIMRDVLRNYDDRW